MSKRYRFVIVIVAIALCFVFLYPTIKWYFWTNPDDKQSALQTRQQIRDDAKRIAESDYKRLYEAAAAGAALPDGFAYLLKEAKDARSIRNMPKPAAWDAKSTLLSFETPQIVQNCIETAVRKRILALKDLQKNAVQLGLDLSGGLSIVLQANLASYEAKIGHTLNDTERGEAMEQALEVLNSRIDRFGLTEPVIRRQGSDQIYVEIPGTADPERINSIVMGKGSLNLRLVDEEATKKFNTYYASNPLGTFDEEGKLRDPSIVGADCEVLGVFVKDEYGLDMFSHYLAVKKEIGLDGNHIKSASVSKDNFDGTPHVAVELDSEGGDIFWKLTSSNVGKPLAIVLDDRIRSAPVIREGIRNNMSISGFNADEANNLALTLRTAALPVELEVVHQQSIGASLGKDYIAMGLKALIGGLGAVMVFLLIFYRGAGINAIMAQVLNIYIMFSVLSAFNFTLTLPSIAGFILTIGMAVDANVIIFERMKEELRLGKTRKAVVEAGFNKAFWAIMDSNITTFIAALFLSQLGSGPIQGFAVSLAIGVFSSVFTALFVSRLIFDFGTDLGAKKFSLSWRRVKPADTR
ncbi:MAG: protein translocase subunit SecD [Spirochaetaceae bacterium]|jgi:preprotein translocase subunit SecD|nr:protein translocase subunit SecD [Spirochaetaceae bacterium]GMO21139.1 MAG: protein translocase subunit SecD [Termitinemataceae bacterium]